MVNQKLLQEYSNSIKTLKKQCIDAGMSEEEYKNLYLESLKSLQRETNNRQRFMGKYKILLLGIIIAVLITYNFKVFYSNIICHLQEYIYPGLRLLRRICIPFISLFPSLTDLYHETCLIQNPFFTVVDMDCWPCSSVNNVREINNPKPVNNQNNAPFLYETEQKLLNIEALEKLYTNNKILFDKESPKILTNNKYYLKPHEMFHDHLIGEKGLYIWKFNSMNMARLLRQVIPRPKVVPKFGQSTERYIIIDSSKDSFHIPDTECSFSFLLLLSGTRTVSLIPAEECKHQCKTFQVHLKERYLLWYNWWYWRPVVQPSTGNGSLIAHVGSYC